MVQTGGTTCTCTVLGFIADSADRINNYINLGGFSYTQHFFNMANSSVQNQTT